MIRLKNISLAPDRDSPAALASAAAHMLGVRRGDLISVRPVRRSIDARHKNSVRIIYTVDVAVSSGEDALIRRSGGRAEAVCPVEYSPPAAAGTPALRPVVAGFGPAGMFASLLLAGAGLRPLIIERGDDVDTRTEKVRSFWENGVLDTESNVQFGEGGAGTFSDGKLNTGIGGGGGRVDWILRRFAEFGADEKICFDSAPHVGTDVLSRVVKNIRESICESGGEICFRTRLTGLIHDGGELTGITVECGGITRRIPCSRLILAVGHSARDTFAMLSDAGMDMEPKAFSMGVRIEHLQADINRARHGRFAGLPALGAAAYKLSRRLPDGGSAYTFCMCPGGYVTAAASEDGSVVTNGMSYSGRGGVNANSALLVTLTPDIFPYGGALGGVRWQREIERAAFEAGGGNYRAPAQLLGDFMSRRPSSSFGRVLPTYRPGVTPCDLHDVLPGYITGVLERAIPLLGRDLDGFDSPDAVLTAPETRSSSPVRINRGAFYQARLRGLYPCGEGAGYAGGIVSAAADGMRCAEAVINSP